VKIMALHTPVTILVIDDEPSITRGLAQLLRREGYMVATAANGRSALTQLQVQPYDVILSDLHMPDLDGQAFYALLRQQYPALCPRVIFFTGAASEATNRAFLAQCGQPWLRKPFSFAVLRRVLAQMLGGGPPANIVLGR
jgi:CheY-like chemotaxis protein